MSNEPCNCGCNAPVVEKTEECTCGCGGHQEQKAPEHAAK
jgi:hypothetical protein